MKGVVEYTGHHPQTRLPMFRMIEAENPELIGLVWAMLESDWRRAGRKDQLDVEFEPADQFVRPVASK